MSPFLKPWGCVGWARVRGLNSGRLRGGAGLWEESAACRIAPAILWIGSVLQPLTLAFQNSLSTFIIFCSKAKQNQRSFVKLI